MSVFPHFQLESSATFQITQPLLYKTLTDLRRPVHWSSSTPDAVSVTHRSRTLHHTERPLKKCTACTNKTWPGMPLLRVNRSVRMAAQVVPKDNTILARSSQVWKKNWRSCYTKKKNTHTHNKLSRQKLRCKALKSSKKQQQKNTRENIRMHVFLSLAVIHLALNTETFMII